MTLLPPNPPENSRLSHLGEAQLALIEGTPQGASYRILAQGAQILDWGPKGGARVIWISPHARFQKSKPARGGIPICWPWFGPASDPSLPAHGYARNCDWTLSEFQEDEEGNHLLTFNLVETLGRNPGIGLVARLRIGNELCMGLTTVNQSSEDFSMTEALHSYFGVSDVRKIRISGLEPCSYLDRLDADARKHDAHLLSISGETDRIYLNAPAKIQIDDPGLARRICIETENARSAVVWNPWVDKGHLLGDLGEEDYLRMICVESANVADNALTIAPGQSHTLTVRYRLETLEDDSGSC